MAHQYMEEGCAVTARIYDSDDTPPPTGVTLLAATSGDREYHEARVLNGLWMWTDRGRPSSPVKGSTWMELPRTEP